MRGFWFVAAMLLGSLSVAQAADMPDLPVLRGALTDGLTTTTRNWDGVYVGGQIGYTSANIDFSHAPASMTGFMLRNSVLQQPVSNWGLLSKNHAQANGFGAFVGRNWQWYDAVFGLEANYNYMNNLASSSSDSMERLIVNPAGETIPTGHTHTYDTTLTGGAALQIKDVVTFRGRVGWAGGDFLPYMFGGLAVGRVDVSRFSTVSYLMYDDYNTTTTVGGVSVTTHKTDIYGPTSQTQAERRTNSFVVGWTAGLGVEWAVWNCLFLRGEWEYVRFTSVKDISFDTNNFRIGAGYKF